MKIMQSYLKVVNIRDYRSSMLGDTNKPEGLSIKDTLIALMK